MMSPYEEILNHIDDEKILLIEDDFDLPVNGLYLRDQGKRAAIMVQRQLSQAAKRCVCAEELGHHYTSTQNLLGVCSREYERQEHRARQWAHLALLPLDDIGEAYLRFDACKFTMAEWLDVTADFLDETIDNYREIHGTQCRTRRYLYRFEPYFDVRKRP